MTANTHILIQNTNVDSNATIKLLTTGFTPAWKKMTQTNPLVGNQTARIPEAQKSGIESPTFSIQGVIDVNGFSTDNDLWSITPSTVTYSAENVSGTGYMTLGALQALLKDTSGTTIIQVVFGDPDAQHYWYNYGGTGAHATRSYIYCEIIDFSFSLSGEGLHYIDVSMTVREVAVDGTYT
jgi:hypothetical protein